MGDEGRPVRVLVVDDDEGVRTYLSVVLREEGHQVLTASDGLHAKELLKTEPVDLLIADYNMPGMNGLDLIWWNGMRPPEVPAVLMTGQEDAALTASAHACGAVRVFLKPFPIEELLHLVGQLRRATEIFALTPSGPCFRG